MSVLIPVLRGGQFRDSQFRQVLGTGVVFCRLTSHRTLSSFAAEALMISQLLGGRRPRSGCQPGLGFHWETGLGEDLLPSSCGCWQVAAPGVALGVWGSVPSSLCCIAFFYDSSHQQQTTVRAGSCDNIGCVDGVGQRDPRRKEWGAGQAKLRPSATVQGDG